MGATTYIDTPPSQSSVPIRAYPWSNHSTSPVQPMKIRSLLISSACLAGVFLAGALLFAQTQPSGSAFSEDAVRKAVLETNAKMSEAANRMDVDAFFSYILDSGSGGIIKSGTVFKSRQEALQAVKQGFMGVAKIDRQFVQPRVTVLSPDAALLVSEGTVAAELSDGRKMNSRFAVSLVFVRRDGAWKLLHGHYSAPPRM